MSWNLRVWWAHRVSSDPPVDEEFDTRAEGIVRAAEVLADGYTESSPGVHRHYPAGAVRFVSLIEDTEE